MTTHCGKDRTYYQHSRTGELTVSEVTADLQNNVGRIAQGLHCGDAVPQHREQPLLQFRPYEIPRLSLSHARGCREDVRVRINQTGQRRLPSPSINTRPVAGATEISVILPPLTTMEAFSICSWPVKTRTFEMTKSFCAYAVTESPESQSCNQCAVH